VNSLSSKCVRAEYQIFRRPLAAQSCVEVPKNVSRTIYGTQLHNTAQINVELHPLFLGFEIVRCVSRDNANAAATTLELQECEPLRELQKAMHQVFATRRNNKSDSNSAFGSALGSGKNEMVSVFGEVLRFERPRFLQASYVKITIVHVAA
jgi:hypothetical protein